MNVLAKRLERIARELVADAQGGASNFVQVTLQNFVKSVNDYFEKLAEDEDDQIQISKTISRGKQFESDLRSLGQKIYNAVWKHPEELDKLYKPLEDMVTNMVNYCNHDKRVEEYAKYVLDQAKDEIFA